MNKPWYLAGRQACAVVLAGLAMGIIRNPQPFLCILAAFLLASNDSLPHSRIFFRIAGACAGALAACLLISLFPEQPWLLLPAFALLITFGIRWVSFLKDDSVVLMALLGLVTCIPTGIVHPAAVLTAGGAHAVNLTCGILSAAIAFSLFPPEKELPLETSPVFPFQNALLVGVTTSLSMIVASMFLPGAAVVVIAAALMIFRLAVPDTLPLIPQKALGAILGALIAIAFDIIIAGAGNDIAFFLVALAVIFGTLAWIGNWQKKVKPIMLQAASMFAVAAPMLPRPYFRLEAMGIRIAAVLIGCAFAILIYLIPVWRERREWGAVETGKKVS
ncbi:MAG: hypothetical protein ABI615_13585 [Chthoniobacterales bacterium]